MRLTTPKKIIKIILISLLCSTLYGNNNKPVGLLTDLVEHTDYTWHNGLVSTVPVWEVKNVIEPLQFVSIKSEYPSFSWIVPNEMPGTIQTAYRIIVSDNLEQIISGIGNVWDSGLVESGKSTSVIYQGNALLPEKNYFWRVRLITNSNKESEWSDIKGFRTANKMFEYATSYYPQVKSVEHPVLINKMEESSFFVDFGKAAFGQLVVNLTSNSDKDSIVIHLGECELDGRVDSNPGGTIRYQRYVIGLIKGSHTYRIKIAKDKRNTGSAAVLIPDYIGEVLPFRYCEIEDYKGIIKPSDIIRESVHYPFDDLASSFECSNDTLNQIWNMCKYSIKATSVLGVYIDGDRERIPYEADALINQLCHYGVDREYSMARRSHEYLLKYPTWPTEWILQAILIAWNDYMYTGDSRSLKSNYDILKARALMQLREDNGLISTTTGLQTPEFISSIRFKDKIRDIVDWPHTGILGLNKQEGGEADGFVFTDYNSVTNAFHFEALKLMAKIARVLNIQSDVDYYDREVRLFLPRYNQMFFNKKTGYYVDGDTTHHASLHANMFPIAFGMVPMKNQKSVLDLIISRKMACSVYGSQFLMDALYEASYSEDALSMLTKTDDRSWYNMIRVGSTISLEAWDNKYKPNQDWNHAWGAVPANIIPRKLMGVEPLTPGFDQACIKPQTASLAWAKATIPTIKGKISLSIENTKNNYNMQVIIPANMEAEVYLPLLSNKYEVRVNGISQKVVRQKNTPFLFLGNLPSGSYDIKMNY